MTSMIPRLVLTGGESGCFDGCCANTKGSQVVFDKRKNKFEVKKYTVSCCSCLFGGPKSVEQERTWRAFEEALKKQHGVGFKELQVDSSKKLTPELFSSIVEMAESRTVSTDARVSANRRISFNLHFDFRSSQVREDHIEAALHKIAREVQASFAKDDSIDEEKSLLQKQKGKARETPLSNPIAMTTFNETGASGSEEYAGLLV